MAWRPHGHARSDPNRPSSYGVCDRCGWLYNLAALVWERQWFGPRIESTRFRVCRRCLDKPSDQLRPIITGPDPLPTINPRAENYAQENLGISAQQAGTPPFNLKIPISGTL